MNESDDITRYFLNPEVLTGWTDDDHPEAPAPFLVVTCRTCYALVRGWAARDHHDWHVQSGC